jgi:hypothetical protein
LDVFVSYARADDEVPEGSSAKFGWVTTLARNLNVGPNVYKKDLFIDHRLRPGDAFDPDLLAKIERSRLLVVLLSQNYIDSTWCGKELDWFVTKRRNDRTRPEDVFVVELVPYEDLLGCPDNIQQLRKYLIHAKFWYQPFDASTAIVAGFPTPSASGEQGEKHYWRVLRELQAALDRRLREQRRAMATATARLQELEPGRAVLEAAPRRAPASVLLADVTEDLEAQRNAVKAALEAEHMSVLPHGDYVGLTAQEFDVAIAADLAHAQLFVQLLSPTTGRKLKGFAKPLAQLQFDRAQAVGVPILQWSNTPPPQCDEAGHASLFQTEFLQVTHLEAFKDNVLKTLRAVSEQRRQPPGTNDSTSSRRQRKVVFVDDAASEQSLSGRLRAIIRSHNYEIRTAPAALPLDSSVNIKETLKPCRAGITLFTDRDRFATVYNRLIFFLNQRAEANLALTRWGVYFDGSAAVASEFGRFGIDSEDVVPVCEQNLAEFLRGLSE